MVRYILRVELVNMKGKAFLACQVRWSWSILHQKQQDSFTNISLQPLVLTRKGGRSIFWVLVRRATKTSVSKRGGTWDFVLAHDSLPELIFDKIFFEGITLKYKDRRGKQYLNLRVTSEEPGSHPKNQKVPPEEPEGPTQRARLWHLKGQQVTLEEPGLFYIEFGHCQCFSTLCAQSLKVLTKWQVYLASTNSQDLYPNECLYTVHSFFVLIQNQQKTLQRSARGQIQNHIFSSNFQGLTLSPHPAIWKIYIQRYIQNHIIFATNLQDNQYNFSLPCQIFSGLVVQKAPKNQTLCVINLKPQVNILYM